MAATSANRSPPLIAVIIACSINCRGTPGQNTIPFDAKGHSFQGHSGLPKNLRMRKQRPPEFPQRPIEDGQIHCRFLSWVTQGAWSC
jgi:hypothetical protein